MSPAEANNNVGYIAMKNGDLEPAQYFYSRLGPYLHVFIVKRMRIWRF